MTMEQVFAAKEMYKEQINNYTKIVKINRYNEEEVFETVQRIMKKTTSDFVIKRVLNFYKHYVEMCMRVSYTLWEDEEQ